MSDIKKRYKISTQIMEEEFVSEDEKAQALQTALYDCTKLQPFLGTTLQCLNIAYSHMLPTAGISFNNDDKRWDMYINPRFFCKKLSFASRVGVLLHEIDHIVHKHPLRVPFLKLAPRKRMLMNIAADMAINQFIKNLPKGCSQCPPLGSKEPCKNEDCPGRAIFVQDFAHTNEDGTKTPFKTDQTMEYYYEELIKMFDDPDDQGNESGEGEGGEGDGEGGGKGQGQCERGNAGGGADHSDLPQTMDVHDWDGSGEEGDMLEATEDLVKRAMVKSSSSYDQLPDYVQELLADIAARKAELNYRALILSAIKKSASGHARESSWTRKSKRWGVKAPGTKVSNLPKLHMYIDTSGSISIEEANEFLDIVDNFLRTGARKCRLNLFHTANYYSKEYRLKQRLERDQVQSGGTDLEHSMRDIAKRRPDLAVILTDGYYSNVEVEKLIGLNDKFPQCLFIISREGDKDHPLRRLGETILIPSNRNTG